MVENPKSFSDNLRFDVIGLAERSKAAFKGLQTQMKQLEGLSKSFAASMTQAFKSAVFDGEKLDKVFAKLALSVSKIALGAAQKPIETGLNSIFESAFKGLLENIIPFARGGVISSPMAFPLGNGLGLAGEAGPEAILPLVRGAGGKLGVAASGGGGGVVVNFNVNAADAASFLKSETQLAAMLNRMVSRGKRNL